MFFEILHTHKKTTLFFVFFSFPGFRREGRAHGLRVIFGPAHPERTFCSWASLSWPTPPFTKAWGNSALPPSLPPSLSFFLSLSVSLLQKMSSHQSRTHILPALKVHHLGPLEGGSEGGCCTGEMALLNTPLPSHTHTHTCFFSHSILIP